MSDVKLEIIFSDEQLETIYASRCKVIIGKYGNTPESQFGVAWQAFRPLGSNCITWGDDYGLYASSTRLLEGAKLHQTSYSKYAAVRGRQYTLMESGVISNPGDQTCNDKFYMLNNYSSKKIMTVGLCQKASINGEFTKWNAISAVPVMNKHAIFMKPTHRVSVWLESMIESNTVFSSVESPKTNIHFSVGVPAIQLTYDSDIGSFVAK